MKREISVRSIEDVMSMVVPVVIGEKACETVYANVLTRKHMNFRIGYAIPADDGYGLIRKDTLEGVSEELVNGIAMAGMTMEEYSFKSMGEIMAEILDEPIPELDEAKQYVLMAKKYGEMYGARCILRPDVLKEVSGKIGGDYYILPSSIHELIIMPATIGGDGLAQMVQDINRDVVDEKDVLSDTVYRYNAKTEKLEIIQ